GPRAALLRTEPAAIPAIPPELLADHLGHSFQENKGVNIEAARGSTRTTPETHQHPAARAESPGSSRTGTAGSPSGVGLSHPPRGRQDQAVQPRRPATSTSAVRTFFR